MRHLSPRNSGLVFALTSLSSNDCLVFAQTSLSQYYALFSVCSGFSVSLL